MLGAVKLERDRLVDGHSHGFRRGVTIVSDMNCDSLSLQASPTSGLQIGSTAILPRYLAQLLLLPAPARKNQEIAEVEDMDRSGKASRIPAIKITPARIRDSIRRLPSLIAGSNSNSSTLLIPDSYGGTCRAKRPALLE